VVVIQHTASTFRINVFKVPALKMEAAYSSETLVYNHTTLRGVTTQNITI
jgi:hypothetical protein